MEILKDDKESEVKNAKSILDLISIYDYYGLHSEGNIYDILPVKGKMVQFWTQKKDNKTYCIALTKNQLLYSLQVFKLENEKAISVSDSLFFDEFQDVDLTLYPQYTR